MSLLKTLMAGAVMVAATGAAQATPLEITLQSGGQTAQFSGGSPLQYNQPIGNFTVASGSGSVFSDPNSLDLSSISATSSAAGQLIITLSADDLTGATGSNWLTSFTGHSVFGSGTTLVIDTYIDYANQLLGTATALSTFSTTFSTGLMNSEFLQVVGALTPTAPYALTEVLTITTTGSAGVSTDASITNVPEPTTLALLGTGLFGLGLLRLRNRKRSI